MNPNEFQPIARDAAQANLMRAQELLAEAMERENPHPDMLVKVVNASAPIAQAIPEKKTDPNAGLAVFHISFVGGRQQLTASATPAELVEEVQPQRQLEAPAPEKKARKSRRKAVEVQPIDDTVDEMKRALDALLE